MLLPLLQSDCLIDNEALYGVRFPAVRAEIERMERLARVRTEFRTPLEEWLAWGRPLPEVEHSWPNPLFYWFEMPYRDWLSRMLRDFVGQSRGGTGSARSRSTSRAITTTNNSERVVQ